MKVQVVNLSSGLLALPAPISLTLGGGKRAVVSLSDPDWRTVQSSPAFTRLMQTRMLSVTALAEAAPAPVAAPVAEVAAAPEPVVEPVVEPVAAALEPEPTVEVAVAPESVSEPVAVEANNEVTEPVPAVEPAQDEPAQDEPKKKLKKKKAES